MSSIFHPRQTPPSGKGDRNQRAAPDEPRARSRGNKTVYIQFSEYDDKKTISLEKWLILLFASTKGDPRALTQLPFQSSISACPPMWYTSTNTYQPIIYIYYKFKILFHHSSCGPAPATTSFFHTKLSKPQRWMRNAISSTSRMSYIAEMTRINVALSKSPFVNGNCTIRAPTGYRRFMRYVNRFPQLAADNA